MKVHALQRCGVRFHSQWGCCSCTFRPFGLLWCWSLGLHLGPFGRHAWRWKDSWIIAWQAKQLLELQWQTASEVYDSCACLYSRLSILILIKLSWQTRPRNQQPADTCNAMKEIKTHTSLTSETVYDRHIAGKWKHIFGTEKLEWASHGYFITVGQSC